MSPSININSIDEVKNPARNDRILVFSPHCDDEALAPGGLISRAAKKRIPVKVVLITNGDDNIFSTDIEFKKLYPTPAEFVMAGERRQQETLAAMRVLGLSERDVVFLGFPDRGIKALYRKNWKKPYKSRGTKDIYAPYRRIYEKHVLYTGEGLSRDIRKIINDFQPTVVIAPHLKDHHPDHRYSAGFIIRILDEVYRARPAEERPYLLTYLVHHPYYPAKKGLKPDSYLLPPFHETFSMDWLKVMLSEEEEDAKWKAIMEYKSQLPVPELGHLMKSFIRKNELFESLDYTAQDVLDPLGKRI